MTIKTTLLAATALLLAACNGGDNNKPPPPVEPPPEPPPLECVVAPITQIEPEQYTVFDNRIPGIIEAEDFDFGGLGIAYGDSDAVNTGNVYRTGDGVDMKATGDTSGSYQIGWVKSGEWLEYTTWVCEGTYEIQLRVSCGGAVCGTIAVSLGGEVLGTVQVPSTGSWDQNYVTVTIPNVQVSSGVKILRLDFSGGPLDLNWIRFIEPHLVNHAPTNLFLCPANPDGSIILLPDGTIDLSQCEDTNAPDI